MFPLGIDMRDYRIRPAAMLLSLLISTAVIADDLDFNRDIRPILSENCYACHGPDEKARKAELRLDDRQAAIDAGAFVPGKVDESELVSRVNSLDPDAVMPPTDSKFSLTAEEKKRLSDWIAQGAEFADHWSFIPPKKIPVPKSGGGWARNEIDRFVHERLLAEKLKTSPEADRYALARRLSLDLTGLPPTSVEVMSFVNDKSEDAYEKLVDHFLSSPHFGERMALDWLDAARYADTNGFSIDGGRHIWLWRDWVIHAFNTNMPFDQFLVDQVAGDLLPNPTPAQLIASGFQRNNMVTHEGGTIPAENLTNYNADRVKTLGEAVLGLTVGCAQCHDHKYDAITQKDYYSLFAYFNTLNDVGLDGNSGVNPRPYLKTKTVLQTGEEEPLRRRIEKLKERLANPSDDALLRWEKQQRAVLAKRGDEIELLPLRVIKVSTPNRGSGFEVADEKYVRITQPSGLAAYDVSAEIPKLSRPITGLRVVFHPDESMPGGGWGHAAQKVAEGVPDKGTFKLTAISVSVGEVPADQVDLFRLLNFANITANTWQTDQRPTLALDPRRQNGWTPELVHDGAVHLTVTFDRPLDAETAKFMTTQLNFGAGGNQIAARVELFALVGNDDGSQLPPEVIAAFEVENEGRSPEEKATLRREFSDHARQTERLRVSLANAEERLRILTEEFSTMVMKVAEKPRDTFILNRGDYSQPTVKVSMDTPLALPRMDGEQQSRLTLARWITMPNHPLTPRVYTNRVWQMMFGAGIVRTPADFGSQGEWPTHPQLLDWLAVDFVESDWDVKALVKKIAMSATYRQSSSTSADLQSRDPQNLLLARGPRFRLPAEFIRDAALRSSGLLHPQLGGPSVNPYAPGDLWREVSHYGSTPATAQTFVQDHGEKLYRRSMYTFWKRTSPPPNMATFDAPNRETCVVSRPSTNTPLQALVLLNDIQFVEAARATAQRALSELRANAEGLNDQARLQWMWIEIVSRPASEPELQILALALERERKRYRSQPEQAAQLLSVGESRRDRNIDAAEHAAWTQIASTIFNLSEVVTRQ
jgi:hypothetical protein